MPQLGLDSWDAVGSHDPSVAPAALVDHGMALRSRIFPLLQVISSGFNMFQPLLSSKLTTTFVRIIEAKKQMGIAIHGIEPVPGARGLTLGWASSSDMESEPLHQ